MKMFAHWLINALQILIMVVWLCDDADCQEGYTDTILDLANITKPNDKFLL